MWCSSPDILAPALQSRHRRSMPRATRCKSLQPPPIPPSLTIAPAPTSTAFAAVTINRGVSPASISRRTSLTRTLPSYIPRNANGKAHDAETKKALNAAGKQEVMYETYAAGERDYSGLVSKLRQADVDVLFLGGHPTEPGLIVRQMRAEGMGTILMGGDTLITQEFWSIAGPAGEGTLMTFLPDPRKNPAAAEVVKRFRDKGIEPEGLVLYTYAALQAWTQAAQAAGTTDMAGVVKALNENEFDTVIGKFRFNEKGDPNLRPFAVYRWSNGTYDEIGDEAPAPAG